MKAKKPPNKDEVTKEVEILKQLKTALEKATKLEAESTNANTSPGTALEIEQLVSQQVGSILQIAALWDVRLFVFLFDRVTKSDS